MAGVTREDLERLKADLQSVVDSGLSAIGTIADRTSQEVVAIGEKVARLSVRTATTGDIQELRDKVSGLLARMATAEELGELRVQMATAEELGELRETVAGLSARMATTEDIRDLRQILAGHTDTLEVLAEWLEAVKGSGGETRQSVGG